MKNKSLIIFFFLFVSLALGQEKIKINGKISYFSSTNVYVKFTSTKGISQGDTLFIDVKGKLFPTIRVKFLSSISIAGEMITNHKLKVGDNVIAFAIPVKKNSILSLKKEKSKEKIVANKKYPLSGYSRINRNNGVYGRFAVSTYANTSSLSSADFIRWRYTLSLNGDRINNSKYSFDSYVSFNYRSTDWANVKNNIGNALKIYSLSVKYNFNETTSLVVGRKINPVITNISVIDGVQFESKLGKMKYGLIAGSRPNFTDYGLNAKLFEFGAYVSNTTKLGSGNMQNSIAIFQQTNNFKTDRRFLYFQHSSHLIKNISLFLSSEVDLYKRVAGIPQSTFNLTGLYASLHYRPVRFISFSASYDQRKNVIYYETYKSYADSLLDVATRQGLRFRVNIRPIKRLSVFASYGYRFMNGDIQSTYNYNAGLSYSRIPFVTGRISSSFTGLQTSYLKGQIISVRYSKDIFGSSIYSSFGYRNILYRFISGINDLSQNILSVDLTWRIIRKLNLSMSYEGVFESNNNYGRVYLNFTKRF